jgi:DNA-binding NtrC family response regulator
VSLHDTLVDRFTRLASAAIVADDLRQRTDQRDFTLVGPLAGRAYAAGRDAVRLHPPAAPAYFPDYRGAAAQLSNANPGAPPVAAAVSDPSPYPRRPDALLPVTSDEVAASSGTDDFVARVATLTLREARRVFETAYLTAVVARHGGNISAAADAIQMSRSALSRKLSGLDVARRPYRRKSPQPLNS